MHCEAEVGLGRDQAREWCDLREAEWCGSACRFALDETLPCYLPRGGGVLPPPPADDTDADATLAEMSLLEGVDGVGLEPPPVREIDPPLRAYLSVSEPPSFYIDLIITISLISVASGVAVAIFLEHGCDARHCLEACRSVRRESSAAMGLFGRSPRGHHDDHEGMDAFAVALKGRQSHGQLRTPASNRSRFGSMSTAMV